MDGLDLVFEYLFKNAHVKHYPPSNKIWLSPYWSYHVPPKRHFVEVLKKYINEGYKIKTGWVGTSIKGYRDNIIFISEPFSNKGYE